MSRTLKFKADARQQQYGVDKGSWSVYIPIITFGDREVWHFKGVAPKTEREAIDIAESKITGLIASLLHEGPVGA